MSKQIKVTLYCTGIILLVILLQRMINTGLVGGNVSAELVRSLREFRFAAIPNLVMALLTSYMWTENPNHALWKRALFRLLVAMGVFMAAETILALLVYPDTDAGDSLMRYFLSQFRNGFYVATLYTLIWIITPNDVEEDDSVIDK